MNNFVETRDTRNGTFSILYNVELNWTKVVKPVNGYNGGTLQYETQIASVDSAQIEALKGILPNMKVSEDDTPTAFTLKRPAFLGAPGVVALDGNILEPAARGMIGNGSRGDVKISHKNHPKTGRPYVCLEAIKVTELKKFVPDSAQFANDFDF